MVRTLVAAKFTESFMASPAHSSSTGSPIDEAFVELLSPIGLVSVEYLLTLKNAGQH